MAEIVIMPKLGFDMAEGTLVRWVIGEGSPVEKGAVLAEIETDKATVEVESTFTGTVRQHLVEEGAIVPVNTPIAVIGSADEPINLESLLGEGALVEAQKPAPEIPQTEAQPEPMVSDLAAPTRIEVPEASPQSLEKQVIIAEGGQLPGGVRATPLARRIAEELGVDLRKVKGSGPKGRILRSDIESIKESTIVVEPLPSAPGVVFGSEIPADNLVPLSRLRGAIGRRMVQAKQTVPHFYVTYQYDIAALIQLRTQVNALLAEDEKISVNDFIVKAAALALREFPNLNASIDDEHNQVIQHGHINIGVAVAVENGLLTVVCRDVDLKSLRHIAGEVRGLVKRARDGKVKPEDIEGSTFSVSNLGMYGVENFVAIINPPEAAILAVGSAQEVPVIKDGEVRVGLRMKATISVDHRVSDGAEAARFMQALARYLEEPLRLLV
jgi:pyruvate dehydrogenase E2 component (dihydrolipoamide acetyltransferase)